MNSQKHAPKIVVRRLHLNDLDMIRAHFLRLDRKSRRARFCGAVSDIGVTKYAKEIFDNDSIICGAMVDGHLRGLAELRGVSHPWSTTAEAAFSVDLDWQNHGIGDALFDRIFAIAQNRGVKTIQMMCLKENDRMQHLAEKHDAHLHQNQDEVEAVLHPYWPTPMSMAREIMGETQGYMQMMVTWPDKTPPT